jgi:hypothetical protein
MIAFVSGCVGNNGQLPDCHAVLPTILEAIAIEIFTLGYLVWILLTIFSIVMWIGVVGFAVLDARYNFLEKRESK